jgi:hypothetical protein
MVTQRPAHSTRAVSTVIVIAFAGIAAWLFTPWGEDSWLGSGGAQPAPSLVVSGRVVADVNDEGVVTRLAVPVGVRGDDPIRLTQDGRMRAETFMSETAAAAVPARYSVEWNEGNGDELLGPGERATVFVDLPKHTSVRLENPLMLVIRPLDGPALVIRDVLP